ncbi:hypothetical protein F5Y17DRAFT_453521 [Xylariaceae sp. FL0594]|nr:hypothetical protein F5Y17DRAFT_453521 [Xylariaceae sp. FL0594]
MDASGYANSDPDNYNGQNQNQNNNNNEQSGQNQNNSNNNNNGQNNNNNTNIDDQIENIDEVKMEDDESFGRLFAKQQSEGLINDTNDGPWGGETIRLLESTPFPEPQVGQKEDYDIITLPRDPDIKETKVSVTGRIYGILAFRSLLLVLLPSLTEATDHSRAVLVKSRDAGVAKQRFLDGCPDDKEKYLHANDGSDLAGCHWENFEPFLVAVDANETVTYCIGKIKGDKHKNLYSKSTLDSKLGGQKNVDVLLNTRRELVGQGKIPRNKRAKRTDRGDDKAHQEYTKKYFEKWDGVPPPVQEA